MTVVARRRRRSPVRGRLRRRRRRAGPAVRRFEASPDRLRGLRGPLASATPRRCWSSRRTSSASCCTPSRSGCCRSTWPRRGGDVAAGDRARLAPGRGRAAPHRLARGRRGHASGWCCSSLGRRRARRGAVTTTASWSPLWVGVAALGGWPPLGGRHLAGAAARAARRPRVRRLRDLGPRASARRSTRVVVGAALAVPAFSLVAFWLYSLGMHRAAVPSTTAPLIVAQTFVPAAVGVALLGDGVRDGWWPAVVGRAGAGDRRARCSLGRDQLRSPASAATGV